MENTNKLTIQYKEDGHSENMEILLNGESMFEFQPNNITHDYIHVLLESLGKKLGVEVETKYINEEEDIDKTL